MSNLINSLEEASGKKKYQSYLVEMGIEQVTVLIPLEKASLFEDVVNRKPPSKNRELSKIVREFNGILEK